MAPRYRVDWLLASSSWFDGVFFSTQLEKAIDYANKCSGVGLSARVWDLESQVLVWEVIL
jgi:hypothetical protein